MVVQTTQLPKGPRNKRLTFCDKHGKPKGQKVDSLWASETIVVSLNKSQGSKQLLFGYRTCDCEHGEVLQI